MDGSYPSKRPGDPIAVDRTESGVAGGGSGASSLLSPTSTTSSAAASSSAAAAKRRHLTSTASFKHPAPPWKLSTSETLFRILCPGEKTGGVIGKGGSIIRQFREETGARIRIEDAVPGSDDRVILIVAEAQERKGNEERPGEGGQDRAVSPAQRALVRVFERILRVEEERVGEGEEKEIQGQVACRLLAPSSQVGCVLGKGGKIVEKIRQESGAQIRVLSKEQMPAYASPGDELIHISGSFQAVKKALLSVSGCLQDNPKTDAANLATTPKSFGVNFHGASPVQDKFVQRCFFPGHHAQEFHAGQRWEEEVIFRLLCSNEKVGIIIGKGGIIIRTLQSETGATIKVIDAAPDCEERVISISALESFESKHSPTQEAVLRVHSRLTEAGEKGSTISARLLVPSQQIGCLLGRGGNIIAEMRRSTGASIRIFLKEHVPKCAQANDEVVQVIGTFQSVQEALFQITGRIRETIIPPKPHPTVGSGQNLSGTAEISPASLRPRELESPIGRSPTVFPHANDHLNHATDWPPSFLHGADHNASFSYGSDVTGHRSSFDISESPRSWSHQAVNSVRSIPDGTSMTFRSSLNVAVGSGTHAPTVTSTTVEVAVPQQFLGFVYGENGGTLAEIREISGAKVTIHDPKPGAAEGLVIISGPRDKARTAQTLLHAFILCGRSSYITPLT